jgi:hypothetical protein
MRQRVRCLQCHHWTDALLVWAAGDCCPRCNAPMSESDTDPAPHTGGEEPPTETRPWRSADRPWRSPGWIVPSSRLGERPRQR